MQVYVEITTEPIDPRRDLPSELIGRIGAVAEFSGRVRDEEDGRSIKALEYEAYSAMAEREIRRILENLSDRHPCLFAQVIHRVGVVPVGETAIHVWIAARHRAEAFAMLASFMDRLKQDVPIWKCRALACETEATQGSQP